ncbi:MAG: hypothetical protein HY545_00775 [Candidatus Doudnabacteria bacterium]|nr:hypothetical protein [Candidatus Doudnabacteria bacterium]
MPFDYFFWFAQPSSFLSDFDKNTGFIFGSLFVVGVILFVVKLLLKDPIAKRLVNKFFHLFIWIGFSGAIWFGFRYESTPFLGRRFWVGLIALAGLVWLVWNIYYLLLKFKSERQAHLTESIRQRYLPGSKK